MPNDQNPQPQRPSPPSAGSRRLSWLALAVGMISFSLTFFAFVSTKRAAREADLNHFQNLTHRLSSGFDERLRNTASALQTGAVMVARSDDMERAMWIDFLAATGLDSENGMVGLGYVERVPRAEIDAFEQRIRATGLPDYVAERAGDHDPLYLVAYLEPLAENAEALGIDIANGTTRRSAAETATREQRVSMSRRIRVIVGDRDTPGFLLFYPAFRADTEIDTPAAREANLMGWVYAAVRVDALVAPLEEQYLREISFTVHEGSAASDGRMLWDGLGRDLNQTLMGEQEVDVFGQTWTVRTFPRPALIRAPAHRYAWTVLGLGSLGSIGAIMLTLRLTDSRLRALLAAEQASENTAVQEARLRSVFEASPVGLRLREYDQEEALLVNPAYSRITSIPADEAADPESFLRTLHPDDQPKWEAGVRVIDAGESTQQSMDLRFIHPDGKTVWVEYLLRRFDDPVSGTRRVVVAMIDISALKQQAEDLLVSKEAAEQASLAKSQFLAMMSHEIRTPMNGVIGMASLLLETELTEEQQDCAETIAKSGTDLVDIINDILDFSKVEAGQLDLENAPFELSDCIESAIDLNTMRAAEKRLELMLDVETDLPTRVVGDSTRLRQVLINLISNGVKFTETGEVVLRVSRVEETADRSELKFEIIDTGIGIAPENIDRLFESFTQADASITRRYGGTGLGLAISKRLVELMGGTMSCSSQVGEGTTFSFTLSMPLAQDVEAATPAVPLAGHVLLIVGNARQGSILANHCQALGLAVEVASDRAAARVHAEQMPRVDVVLIDQEICGVEGPGQTESLQTTPALAAAKYVVLAPSNRAPRKGADPSIVATLRRPVKVKSLSTTLTKVFAALQTGYTGLIDLPPPVLPMAKPRAIKVLVAEDNLVNQRIFKQMLASLDLEFRIVSDGSQVLPALREEMADLILMDVQMPVMGGLEAAEQVREALRVKDAPWIVAVTANAMGGDRERCIAAGMNDYISKPLKVDQVKAAIERGRAALTGSRSGTTKS